MPSSALLGRFVQRSCITKSPQNKKHLVNRKYSGPEKWKKSQRKLIQVLTPMSFANSGFASQFDKISVPSSICCASDSISSSMGESYSCSACSPQQETESRYQDVSSLFNLFQGPESSGGDWSSSDILSSMLKYTDMVGRNF